MIPSMVLEIEHDERRLRFAKTLSSRRLMHPALLTWQTRRLALQTLVHSSSISNIFHYQISEESYDEAHVTLFSSLFPGVLESWKCGSAPGSWFCARLVVQCQTRWFSQPHSLVVTNNMSNEDRGKTWQDALNCFRGTHFRWRVFLQFNSLMKVDHKKTAKSFLSYRRQVSLRSFCCFIDSESRQHGICQSLERLECEMPVR
jgi:hypothetical protein